MDVSVPEPSRIFRAIVSMEVVMVVDADAAVTINPGILAVRAENVSGAVDLDALFRDAVQGCDTSRGLDVMAGGCVVSDIEELTPGLKI